MGTYLKIAPQGSPVEFTSVNTTNVYSTTVTSDNVISDTATFTTASGYFKGTFSGSFVGLPTSSLDGHNFTTPFYVTASKGYLSFVDNGALTLVSTGSVSNIFLIQDATGSAFTINNQGVTILKTFSGSAPTPVQGGIYFDSYNIYVGIQ
jgi:hypothetical protein